MVTVFDATDAITDGPFAETKEYAVDAARSAVRLTSNWRSQSFRRGQAQHDPGVTLPCGEAESTGIP